MKHTFYLQEIEAPKVTIGMLFWTLNEHSVQVWEKKKKKGFILYSFAFLENTCFVCIALGNGSFEGTITFILKH